MKKRIYLIGICGSGMGGLALLLKERGIEVTGSDINFFPPMSDLIKEKGIKVFKGWDEKNITPDIDEIVVGNVCRRDNPEVLKGKELNISLISMVEALNKYILKDKEVIVVAGTHGKTTTSSLISYLLNSTGENVGFFIGGLLENFKSSVSLGESKFFIIEGDEYDTSFFDKVPKIWRYPLDWGVLTSIEYDHADIYPDESSYKRAFKIWIEEKIVKNGKRLLTYSGDKNIKEIAKELKFEPIWYGLNDEKDLKYSIKPLGSIKGGGERFIFMIDGEKVFSGVYNLTGLHNLKNLCAALGLLNELDLLKNNIEKIKEALLLFKGAYLRQTLIYDSDDIKIFQDFAHHPTAIKETILSFRRRFAEDIELWAIYQPRSATACRNIHTEKYIESLLYADKIILTEPARKNIPEREKLPVKYIIDRLKDANKVAYYVKESKEIIKIVIDSLKNKINSNRLLLFMSNGNFDNIPYLLKEELEKRRQGKR